MKNVKVNGWTFHSKEKVYKNGSILVAHRGEKVTAYVDIGKACVFIASANIAVPGDIVSFLESLETFALVEHDNEGILCVA